MGDAVVGSGVALFPGIVPTGGWDLPTSAQEQLTLMLHTACAAAIRSRIVCALRPEAQIACDQSA